MDIWLDLKSLALPDVGLAQRKLQQAPSSDACTSQAFGMDHVVIVNITMNRPDARSVPFVSLTAYSKVFTITHVLPYLATLHIPSIPRRAAISSRAMRQNTTTDLETVSRSYLAAAKRKTPKQRAREKEDLERRLDALNKAGEDEPTTLEPSGVKV